MEKFIDIVEDKDKEIFNRRFNNKIRYYKRIAASIIAADFILIVLMAVAYISGQTNPMNIGIFMAVVAVFTIPFIMSSLNRVWQLGSDIMSGRVQVLSGRVDKIKTEVKMKRKYNLLFMERTEIKVDDDYCEPFSVSDRINIVQGISSKIPVSVVKKAE